MERKLSKSQYVKGLQCAKALWLYRHQPELGEAPDPFQESIMEAGTEFGVLARQRWPGGVLIDAAHNEPEKALEQTTAAIAAGAITLYEAAVLHDDVLVRVDVLVRLSPTANAWQMVEVKSGTKVEDVHLRDVAIQRHVLGGAGFNVVSACVAHANPEYVRRGELDLAQLFKVEEAMAASAPHFLQVPVELGWMKAAADAPEAPAKAIGDHCNKPYECAYKRHCWKAVPEYSVFNIPYLKMEKKLELFNGGTKLVHEVDPQKAGITDKRSLKPILAARAGKPQIDLAAMRAWLAGLVYPLAHLDFETHNPPVPPFDLLRPYSQMPFQASVRVQQERGAAVVEHAFLGDGLTDPRPALAEFLADVVPGQGSVLAYYKPFEEGRLAELAYHGVAPERFQKALLSAQGRLQDLADPFSKNWYTHPGFKGKWSIKNVAPVLAPGLSYEGLLVGNGAEAMAAYGELRDPNTTPDRRAQLREGLTVYCGQDTEAMALILAHLYEVAEGVPA